MFILTAEEMLYKSDLLHNRNLTALAKLVACYIVMDEESTAAVAETAGGEPEAPEEIPEREVSIIKACRKTYA